MCRELARKNNVYLLALSYLWDEHRYVNDLHDAGVKVIFPGFKNIYDYPLLVKKLPITSVIYEWYETAERFLKYFPLCPQNIIDTHELYYVKEAERYRIEKKKDDAGYVRGLKKRELDIYRMADVLIAISEEEKRILTGAFPRKKIVLLPTWGTPHGKRANAGFADRKDIVFFASFYNSEQLDAVKYFINSAMPAVNKALPEVRLHVAGDRSSLVDRMLKGKERKRVQVDGKIADMYGYLSAFRVFVCPLRYGAGQKKKVLDAAFAGCPMVTTRAGIDGYALRPGTDVLVGSDGGDLAQRPATAARQDGPARWSSGPEQAFLASSSPWLPPQLARRSRR
jgi:glycosyltransferase involved in cell wall biosynthesis